MANATTLSSSDALHDSRREEGPYPKTYRLTTRAVFLFVAIGGAIIFCGLLALRFSLHQLITQGDSNFLSAFRLAAVCIPFIGLGVWFSGTALVYRLTISKDSIEQRYLFRNKRFFLSEIAGKKVYPASPVRTVVIYPVDRGMLPMKIEMLFKHAEGLDEWIGLIPDLGSPPDEWRKHLKYMQMVRTVSLSFTMGIPICYLLVQLARRHLEF
jgi:hypothetical protein